MYSIVRSAFHSLKGYKLSAFAIMVREALIQPVCVFLIIIICFLVKLKRLNAFFFVCFNCIYCWYMIGSLPRVSYFENWTVSLCHSCVWFLVEFQAPSRIISRGRVVARTWQWCNFGVSEVFLNKISSTEEYTW